MQETFCIEISFCCSMASESVSRVPVYMRGRRATVVGRGAACGSGGGSVPARVAPATSHRQPRAFATAASRSTAYGAQRSRTDPHRLFFFSILLTFSSHMLVNSHDMQRKILISFITSAGFFYITALGL